MRKRNKKNASQKERNDEDPTKSPSSSSSSSPRPQLPLPDSDDPTPTPSPQVDKEEEREPSIPPMLPPRRTTSSKKKRTVCIVVLGDIGRSPRMRYHAESFVKEGFLVSMIGYEGSGGMPPEIRHNPSITTIGMREAPLSLQTIPRLLAYPLKVAWLSVMLTWAFLKMVVMYQFRPEFIVVQNPPAIPSLGLCWVYSKIFACDLVVDWHNYGFSIMAMGMGGGRKNPILRFATWFENYFGRKGDAHLCVTRAMKDDLKERIGVDAVTLYDRPPVQFKSMDGGEKLEFLRGFCEEYYPDLTEKLLEGRTTASGGKRGYGVIVSTTSWTEDEDFGILLSALEYYEDKKQICDGDDGVAESKYPDLIVFITGKGPLKEYYRKRIAELDLKHVEIHLPWMKHEDYPKLLGCADLGVSLHTSSSGLDLPMKVVDMFGCGLPVCAVDFKSIGELVQHGVNGWVFKDSNELGQQLMKWFEGMREGKGNRDHELFRANLVSFQRLRWHENWVHNVGPLLGEKS